MLMNLKSILTRKEWNEYSLDNPLVKMVVFRAKIGSMQLRKIKRSKLVGSLIFQFVESKNVVCCFVWTLNALASWWFSHEKTQESNEKMSIFECVGWWCYKIQILFEGKTKTKDTFKIISPREISFENDSWNNGK